MKASGYFCMHHETVIFSTNCYINICFGFLNFLMKFCNRKYFDDFV